MEQTSRTIDQVILAYWRFAETVYVRDGKPTKELGNMRDALRPLRRLFGSLSSADFGPAKLKLVRDHMIDTQQLCRTEVNKRIGRIKRCFKWAAGEELIPPSVAYGLNMVPGLRRGQNRVRESAAVKPVADEAVLPYLPPQLAAMVETQRCTGMRPGEVVCMRPADIEMTGDVWVYRPVRHKNGRREQARAVALGPKAQAILKPILDRPADAFLFSPEEAYRWRVDHRAAQPERERTTPIYTLRGMQ